MNRRCLDRKRRCNRRTSWYTYRWQQVHYPRVEGLQTRARKPNPVPMPAPATRHGQEVVPAPATRGHTRARQATSIIQYDRIIYTIVNDK
jgi:hypothetical protein